MHEAICIPYYISFHIDKVRKPTYTPNNTHPILCTKGNIPMHTHNHMHPILRIKVCIPIYTCNHTRPIPRIKTCIPCKCKMQKLKLMRCSAKLSRGPVKPYGMAALQASTSSRLNHVINECMIYQSHECNNHLTLLRI